MTACAPGVYAPLPAPLLATSLLATSLLASPLLATPLLTSPLVATTLLATPLLAALRPAPPHRLCWRRWLRTAIPVHASHFPVSP
jgi:hypothetical protein